MGRRSKQTKKFPFGIVLLSVLIILTLAGVGVGYYVLMSGGPAATAAGEAGVEKTIVIPSGSSTSAIADILYDSGMVNSALSFRVQARLAGADGSFMAGTYQMHTGMSKDEIFAMLQAGPPRQDVVKVTLPEGRSIDRMGTLLEEAGMSFSAEEFTTLGKTGAAQFAGEFPFLVGAFNDSMEGYLFPDTYEFFEDATVEDVITQMLRRFEAVWNTLDAPTGPAADMSPAQLVTIASLVEMESSLSSERPLVSSVVYNRLAINRKLQFCSTVQYLLPGEERQRLRLTYAQTEVPSPWNTYMNDGLPPGPISNPGREALDAALHPASTDYIYFVLTGTDGSQTFASNTAEFNRARQLSREVFGQ
ncbi:MAG: endolytic transglycosylase MltG [Coriobacteriia bacterium]|nr:endolytic transglycosylase MltG [Coriobacteriia bacterium]MCL2536694.1 endolytic transglycosylase MltG [Coriobacteriia bacterium]